MFYIVIALGLLSCNGESGWTQFQNLDYKGKLGECEEFETAYYLLDLHLKTSADSTLFNTWELGRKFGVRPKAWSIPAAALGSC